MTVRSKKKSELILAESMLALGDLQLRVFLSACGKKQFRNKDRTLYELPTQSQYLSPTEGLDPKRCLTHKAAEGHLVFTNHCEKPVHFLWCHEDDSLSTMKQTYCGQDKERHYFTQGYTLNSKQSHILTSYSPLTVIKWGACFGGETSAHSFNENGGYSCK